MKAQAAITKVLSFIGLNHIASPLDDKQQ
jgi:hypothetical protein